MKDACNLFLYCLKFVFIFPIDQEQVEQFTEVVKERITELEQL